MKLLQSQEFQKGITLNSQLVDLLSILDENIPVEEQDKKINEYILKLGKRQNGYIEASKRSVNDKNKFLIDNILDENLSLTSEQKEKLKLLYLQNIGDISDSDKIISILKENGFDQNIHTQILKDLKNVDFMAKEGVLSLTPEKVRNFYSHLFKEGNNTYDRVTFDNAGKFSSYVALDGKTYADERLKKMIEFCEQHGMKSKINTFMMYCDFPKLLEKHLQSKIDAGEISQEQQKEIIKDSLLKYVEHIGKTYGDRIDTVDIFNELIYDPTMSEEGFKEEPTYHVRNQGWQKYLDIGDLCDIALAARKLMPNATFTYNDMNWTDPKKRKEIIKIVSQIKEVEKEYIEQGKLNKDETLIDTIGFEAHLTTSTNPKQIENAFKEVARKLKMPIEITELDCARVGPNPELPEEINKQKIIFSKVYEMVKQFNVKNLTIWSPSDELSFMNEKCGRKVFASVLDDNFNEKDIEPDRKKNLFSKILEKFKPQPEKVFELPQATKEKSLGDELQSMVNNDFDNKSNTKLEEIEKELGKIKEDGNVR